MRFFIGIDIGTTHTKAIALQSDGFVAATSVAGYEPLTNVPGQHELYPDQLLGAVLATLRDLMRRTRELRLGQPEGIAFSSAMHSIIAVDDAGRPLTNCITWADLRSLPQAEKIRSSGLANEIYRRTGTPVHPMSPLCKLIWLREERPGIFNQAAKFVGIKEYVIHKLTGSYFIDQSIASATGLLDIQTRDWYAPALELAGVEENRLSNIVSTTYIIEGRKNELTRLTGVDAKVPLVIGASDGCLANIGSNALETGDCNITIGTSGAVRMLTDQPATDKYSRVFNYILDETHYVCGGPLNNGGALVEWYADHFLQKDIRLSGVMEALIAQAATVPAGAEGLLFLPYVRGERAPVWDAGARGAFVGLDHRHTQAHAIRAVIEGINYAVQDIAKAVKETIGAPKNIFVSGGFLKSPQWVQWLADLLGQRLVITAAADASAMGAAIMGWKAAGLFPDLSAARQFFQPLQTYEPDAQNHQTLQAYYEVYNGLYKQLQYSFEKLGRLRDPS
ncbi:gluconokinase [Pseudobacter ginsenosidimutans]|uniref:Gluconate kinase (FGGY family) n=1 Tax=Pseudobacter ginsenosidimutans TaxID=661488 RepID=A0A4Q7MHG3_9BACT|nr:gluconokinase [Pseudobacter ginsenosidimutans]QEC45433.1 gluconate kinase [Pseudobacter ginsenosidimutans]RZS66963.1 gluconate kinase (FGGY family) [Pseudobacter ginsenosidimutans]